MNIVMLWILCWLVWIHYKTHKWNVQEADIKRGLTLVNPQKFITLFTIFGRPEISSGLQTYREIDRTWTCNGCRQYPRFGTRDSPVQDNTEHLSFDTADMIYFSLWYSLIMKQCRRVELHTQWTVPRSWFNLLTRFGFKPLNLMEMSSPACKSTFQCVTEVPGMQRYFWHVWGVWSVHWWPSTRPRAVHTHTHWNTLILLASIHSTEY